MRALPLVAGLAMATMAGGCARPLSVMTFNVRYASDAPPNSWAERRPVAVAAIAAARPDVIGTQELLKRQGEDLVAALPDYRWFGRDRRGGSGDEHMGILYRADRLRLVEAGDFWLSDTPERPGSTAWGADYPRMATWAIFATDKGRGPPFLFLNTHLAHRPGDGEARSRSVALILDRLPAIARDLPVVVAGDFNAEPGTPPVSLMTSALSDAWTTAARRRGPEGTYHDFTGQAERRIDYLFVRGLNVRRVETDTYRAGGVYPSDHFPVRATLRFPYR